MSKKFDAFKSSLQIEKDEHKKSAVYKSLSPKMKKAVDELFSRLDTKSSDFLNNFEKNITDVSKKYKVAERELYKYFERETLGVI